MLSFSLVPKLKEKPKNPNNINHHMEGIDDKVPVPFGDMKSKLEMLAGKLANYENEKGAEAANTMRDKLAKSAKIADYPFLSADNVYFAYFEATLSKFKANPQLIPATKKQEETATAGATAPIPLTDRQLEEERERRMREEQLAMAEREAKRDQKDPHPNIYSLQLPTGVSISRPQYDVMSLTAQCAAKAGEEFLEQVAKNYRGNKLFSFINQEDPAYPTFQGLLYAYQCIINYNPVETQDRLEVYERGGAPLDEVITAKGNFLTAEAARTKAALLSDDDLRKRLQWSSFVVVSSFTAADFGLAPVGSSTKATTSTHTTSSVPAGAVGWGAEDDNAHDSEVVGIAKRSGNSEFVKDPTTGELVPLAQLQRKGRDGNGSLFGTDAATAPAGRDGGTRKREREDGLASYSSFEAQLRK